MQFNTNIQGVSKLERYPLQHELKYKNGTDLDQLFIQVFYQINILWGFHLPAQ